MKRYPEYKESGVEWISEIPRHWRWSRLKFHLTENSGGIWRDADEFGKGTHVLRSTEITIEGHWDLQRLMKRKLSKEETDRFLLKEDDLVITKSSGSQDHIGKTGLVDEKIESMNVCYSNFVQRIRPKNHISSKFLHYFMNCSLAREQYKYQSEATTGLVNLSAKSIDELLISLPPIQEQIQIANFLDRKTKHIDKLIRIKERRIALLQEQRTALINQVVTKGLDPNVEMKSSGVEWIGEIPAHWKVNRLKYVAKIRPSNVDKHLYPDEIQVRLCNYTDVYYNDYITVDTVLKKGSCKESEFAKFVLRKGDVIITKDSETPDDIGVPTFVKDDLDNIVCGYHLTMIRPYACLGEFIFRCIQSDRTRRYFELESNGITRYGLGKPSIENLPLPIPTAPEQRQIADFLNNKTQQIDELITTEQRRIELLKEYRRSLISEAVTGKIDVRNEV